MGTTPNEITPGLQAAKDAAVRALNSWIKGTPGTNNNKELETFATRNMVRILKRTVGLLENTKKKTQEWIMQTSDQILHSALLRGLR